jgi:hypothetical protein
VSGFGYLDWPDCDSLRHSTALQFGGNRHAPSFAAAAGIPAHPGLCTVSAGTRHRGDDIFGAFASAVARAGSNLAASVLIGFSLRA